MAEGKEEYLAVLKASYDYDPQSEDELAIKENQVLYLLERIDDDWWKVKIKPDSQEEDSPSGLIPAAYVEQAEHTSVAKALYDYEAAASGELTVKEGDVLLVFDREDEWILVQNQEEGGKAGFVPATYVEEEGAEEEATSPPASQIVVPDSPPPPARPISTYIDPADRVAAVSARAQAADIQTWSVSEVDKKGKKKKGTLGVGNGAVFFASEADRTPVQKWQTADVEDVTVEKSKHIHVTVGGSNPTKLHFNAGNKDTADAIVAKLESAKAAVPSTDPLPPSAPADGQVSHKKNGASVRFAERAPSIIPPREPSEDGDEEVERTEADDAPVDSIDVATVLYDFEGTGEDELSAQEGEQLYVLEKDGDEWWKCRNESGAEGVVPASYLEPSSVSQVSRYVDDGAAAREEAGRRLEAERLKKERMEQERIERERKIREQEERAKAAAAEEEEKRKRRGKEMAAAEAAAQRKQRQEAAKRAQQKAERDESRSPRPVSSQGKPRQNSESSSSASKSENKRGPPSEKLRTWHDRSGQFRVDAAFLGFANGKLRLHKTNGVVIEVPAEKMSIEDMRYVEKFTSKAKTNSPPSTPRRSSDDDNTPLAIRQTEALKRSQQASKKGPSIDWFDFFLAAGCDVDDCTRYTSSFEKDKIDEALLPDITESTMRSLGLREGDIIRVTKHIQQKYGKAKKNLNEEQLLRDAELAKRLQEEENGGRKQQTTSPAPNLFTGPGGVLKNNTQRRGRPQSSKSVPPASVDINAISTASDQISRTNTPVVSSPLAITPSSAPAQPPQRSSSATISGFEDDAWTNRPGSKPPVTTPTPPITAVRAPSLPPAPPTPSAPLPPRSAPPETTQHTVQPTQPQRTGSSLARTSEADVFDQLARLSRLNTNRPAISPAPAPIPSAPSPAIMSPPFAGYNSGMGAGPGQLHSQPTGFMLPQQNGPRGPLAPVPANQNLLQPLIPTTTGFNSFVPTRASNSTSPFRTQSTSYLQPQPTGFVGSAQPLISQPTGFQPSAPLFSQPTGITGGSFGNFGPTSFGQQTNGFTPVQSNPTGFNPSFAQSPFNNVVSSPPPAPPSYSQPSHNNTSPANVFAQMKSGTFASDNADSGPQFPDKYDALRPNPLAAQSTGFVSQGAGWGYQGNTGFQNGYTGY